MNKKIKAASIFVVALFILALPLSAQNQSNLSKATAEVFSNEVDDFLDVNYFADTGFEKWFGVVDAGTAGNIGLGYARNLGALYLGTYFSGNVIGSRYTHDKRLETTWNVNLQEWTSKMERDTYYSSNVHTFDNDLNILIGLGLGSGSLGIKVGVEQNNYRVPRNPINASRHAATEFTSNYNGSIIQYENVQIEYEYKEGGMAIPKLEVGLNLGMGSMTLTPYLGAAIGFYKGILNDQWIGEVTEYSGSALKPVTSVETLNIRGRSENYTNIDAYIGTGIEIGDMSFGVEYGMEMPLYKNEYDLFDGNFKGEVKGTASWVGTPSNYTDTSKTTTVTLDSTTVYETGHVNTPEFSEMTHRIAGGFRYAKDITENFKLGALIGVPVQISKETFSSKSANFHQTTVTYNDPHRTAENYTSTEKGTWQGNIEDTSIFNIAGVLSLGATGTTGKWTFSGGVQLIPVNFIKETTIVTSNVLGGSGTEGTYTSTTTVVYGDGRTEETIYTEVPVNAISVEDTIEISKTYQGISGSVRGGFTFAFNENLALDFQAGVGVGATGGFQLDWSAVNVMFIFKF